jgi:transcriptional regulator with XRE-family HTH domain
MRGAHETHALEGHLPRISAHSVMSGHAAGHRPPRAPGQNVDRMRFRQDERQYSRRPPSRTFRLQNRPRTGAAVATNERGILVRKLASRSNIPAGTLRSYEKGTSLPQLARLVDIGNVYSVTLFDILESTAEYIYRASGDPAPHRTSTPVDKITLRAVVLYCGVTPAQLRMMEVHPRRCETIAEDPFGK